MKINIRSHSEHVEHRETHIHRFILNGEEHRLKVAIERHWRFEPANILEKVRDAIAVEVANILTMNLLKDHSTTLAAATRSLR